MEMCQRCHEDFDPPATTTPPAASTPSRGRERRRSGGKTERRRGAPRYTFSTRAAALRAERAWLLCGKALWVWRRDARDLRHERRTGEEEEAGLSGDGRGVRTRGLDASADSSIRQRNAGDVTGCSVEFSNPFRRVYCSITVLTVLLQPPTRASSFSASRAFSCQACTLSVP